MQRHHRSTGPNILSTVESTPVEKRVLILKLPSGENWAAREKPTLIEKKNIHSRIASRREKKKKRVLP